MSKFTGIRIYIMTAVLVLSLNSVAFSQDLKPAKPLIEYVTVLPACGGTHIQWNPSTSTGIDYYKIYSLKLTQPLDQGSRAVAQPAVELRLVLELLAAEAGDGDKAAVDRGQGGHVAPELLVL